jgi:ribokinase
MEDIAPRIAVVGSINVDLTTFTDAFPRPGETIFGREFHLGFGGKGANQAVAASLCGARTAMVARVGDDLFGTANIRNLQERGVDTGRVLLTPGVTSGVAPIFVDSSGQNRILVVKGANDRLLPEDVDAASHVLGQADAIVVQLEVPLESVYHTLRFARSRGIRALLNPAPGQSIDMEQAANADYVIPNETEAEALTGLPVRNLDEARACAARLLELGLRRIILTMGSSGLLLAGPEGIRHFAPFRVKPVDTTGAGDAFIGSFATFLAAGRPEDEAIARASLYAALSTLGAGTQTSFIARDQFEEQWLARAAEMPEPAR